MSAIVLRGDAARLYEEFVRLLTTDSPHHDRRRRDFNQAVFMADGKPVWTETTLDMITDKFEKAARNLGLASAGNKQRSEGEERRA